MTTRFTWAPAVNYDRGRGRSAATAARAALVDRAPRCDGSGGVHLRVDLVAASGGRRRSGRPAGGTPDRRHPHWAQRRRRYRRRLRPPAVRRVERGRSGSARVGLVHVPRARRIRCRGVGDGGRWQGPGAGQVDQHAALGLPGDGRAANRPVGAQHPSRRRWCPAPAGGIRTDPQQPCPRWETEDARRRDKGGRRDRGTRGGDTRGGRARTAAESRDRTERGG
jgi:hypothetical protein